MPLLQVHCVWAAAEAYSAPSIVLTSRSRDGLHVFDDFREAYAWLSHNTDVDDKVCSQLIPWLALYVELAFILTVRCFTLGCFLVGLRLPNNCNGQQNCDCRQQYLEQHSHSNSWYSNVIPGKSSLGNLQFFRCQIRACCLWRFVLGSA